MLNILKDLWPIIRVFRYRPSIFNCSLCFLKSTLSHRCVVDQLSSCLGR